MKFYNKVDLELLKDKISLEALEENIATLTKDNAIKDIKIEMLENDLADLKLEILGANKNGLV